MNTRKQELNILVEKGLITSYEREKLLANDVKTQVPNDLTSTKSLSNSNNADVIEKIVIFGSVLVGIGVILFVGTNWTYIPDFIKNIMLISFVVICYIVGIYLRDIKNNFRTGEAIMLLGGISIVGALALISQTYHVVSDGYGTLLLIWGICLLFPTYTLISRPHSVLLAGVLGVTLQVNISEKIHSIGGYSWVNISATTLLITSLIFFTIGGLHYISSRYLIIGKYYRNMALFFATVSLYFLTDYNKYTFNYYDNTYGKAIPQDFVILTCILSFVSVILCLVSIWLNVPKDMVRKQAHIFPILLSIAVPISLLIGNTSSSSMVVAVIYNLLYICGTLYIIFFGTVYGYRGFVNFGIAAFGLYFLVKVISWLWQLEGSLFFIFTGLLLIFVGYVFEKARINLLNKIPNQ